MVGTPSDLLSICYSSHVNLDEVNKRLLWNPVPFDRELRFQYQIFSASPSSSPSSSAEISSPRVERSNRWEPLWRARNRAEHWAYRLTHFEDGRRIIESERAESPSSRRRGYNNEKYYTSSFWEARAEYYIVEYNRLREMDSKSRTVTPGYLLPRFFGKNELDQAKGHAQNAAWRLETIPAGKMRLQAERHGPCPCYPHYEPYTAWLIEAPSTTESCTDSKHQQACACDPQYWAEKKKEWEQLYECLPKETETERAWRHAMSKAKRLSAFPKGQQILAQENVHIAHGSTQYWEEKETLYQREFELLREEFWSRQKQKYGRETPYWQGCLKVWGRDDSPSEQLPWTNSGENVMAQTTMLSEPRPAAIETPLGKHEAWNNIRKDDAGSDPEHNQTKDCSHDSTVNTLQLQSGLQTPPRTRP